MCSLQRVHESTRARRDISTASQQLVSSFLTSDIIILEILSGRDAICMQVFDKRKCLMMKYQWDTISSGSQWGALVYWWFPETNNICRKEEKLTYLSCREEQMCWKLLSIHLSLLANMSFSWNASLLCKISSSQCTVLYLPAWGRVQLT